MTVPPVPAHAPRTRTALGYARVSTEDQMKGYSIEHQRSAILASCQAEGVHLVAVIGGEHGESGKDLERPGILSLENALRADESIGYVVCTRLDRLTRNFNDCAQLLDVFRTHQIKLVSVEEGGWAEADGDNFMRYIRSLVAAHERHAILQRSAAGQKQAAIAGQHIGGRRPFGYAWQPLSPGSTGSSRAKKMVVVPAEADVVRALFATAQRTGWGCRRLAEWVVRQFPHLGPFSPGRVRGILTNPAYTGEYQAHLRNKAQVVVIADHHEALVDREVFATVQKLQASRSQDYESGHADTTARSLLGGIAQCGRCGQPLVLRGAPPAAQTNPAHAPGPELYICQSTCDGPGCGLEPADARAVEVFLHRLVEDQLAGHHQRLQQLKGQINERVSDYLDRNAGVIRKNLEALAQERLDWEQRLETGAVELDVWQRHDQHLAQQVAKFHDLARQHTSERGLLQLLQAQSAMDGTVSGSLRWVTFAEGLASLSPADRRRFMRLIADRLVWHGPQAGPDFAAWWTIEGWHVDDALSSLADGMARSLAETGGWDVIASMQRLGWILMEDSSGLRWRHPTDPTLTLVSTPRGLALGGTQSDSAQGNPNGTPPHSDDHG